MGRTTFKLQFMLDTSLTDEDRFPLRTRDLIVMPIGDTAPTSVQWGAGKENCLEDIPTVGMGNDAWYKPKFYSDEWIEFFDMIKNRPEDWPDICVKICDR